MLIILPMHLGFFGTFFSFLAYCTTSTRYYERAPLPSPTSSTDVYVASEAQLPEIIANDIGT